MKPTLKQTILFTTNINLNHMIDTVWGKDTVMGKHFKDKFMAIHNGTHELAIRPDTVVRFMLELDSTNLALLEVYIARHVKE